MIRTLWPSSISRGVTASTNAVLPEPTGPPMPMRVVFFTSSPSVHEHANVRPYMNGREDVGHRREAGHVGQGRPANLGVVAGDRFVDGVQDRLDLAVVDPHQAKRRAQLGRA